MEENNDFIKPIFTSKTILDKKGYADFSSVAYIGLFKILASLFLIFIITTLPQQFLMKNLNQICSISFILSIFFWILYVRVNFSSENRYKQMLISNSGKSEIIHTNFYIDRIEINTNNSTVRTYRYSDIKGISETPNSVLLHIGMNVYIIVSMETLTGGTKLDFISFIKGETKEFKIKRTKWKKTLSLFICILITFLTLEGLVSTAINGRFTKSEHTSTSEFGDTISIVAERKENLHHTFFYCTVEAKNNDGSYKFLIRDPDEKGIKITSLYPYTVTSDGEMNLYGVQENYIFVYNGHIDGFSAMLSYDEYKSLELSNKEKNELLKAIRLLISTNNPDIQSVEFKKILQSENIE